MKTCADLHVDVSEWEMKMVPSTEDQNINDRNCVVPVLFVHESCEFWSINQHRMEYKQGC